MKHSPRMAQRAGVVFAALLGLGLSARPALAQQDKVLSDGRLEYEENCTNCHGLVGRGDGQVADLLIVRPPDLTQIAKRNGGVFPFWKVYDMIGGQKPVRAHEFSGMPHWADRFRTEEQTRYLPPAEVRILLLTHYLESIQEK
jgi:mono/diheme cytochrome c family protein